jgi:hypothetical protein
MYVHRSERIWLIFGVAMLAVFLGVITTAAIVDGFVPPSRVQTIDPTKVSQTPPFDHPGLHKIADGQYEAYYVVHAGHARDSGRRACDILRDKRRCGTRFQHSGNRREHDGHAGLGEQRRAYVQDAGHVSADLQ